MPVKTGVDGGTEDEDGPVIYLKMTLTPKYPEEVPVLEVLDSDPDADVDDNTSDDGDEVVSLIDEYGLREPLMEHLNETAEENLGMVMGFTVISAASEWLTDRWEAIKREQDEIKERIKQEQEEAEKVRTTSHWLLFTITYHEKKVRKIQLMLITYLMMLPMNVMLEFLGLKMSPFLMASTKVTNVGTVAILH